MYETPTGGKPREPDLTLLNMPQDHEVHYVDTLEAFLHASTEDRVDVQALLEQLPIYAPELYKKIQMEKSITILDVGTGNGEKAFLLAEALRENGVVVTLDGVEPKAEQCRRLEENAKRHPTVAYRTLSQTTLEALTTETHYDLIIAIHSVYEFPKDSNQDISLQPLKQMLAENAAVAVILEHPEGDFQSMKREIYPLLGKCAPVNAGTVSRALASAGLPACIGERVPFQFPIQDAEGDAETIGRSMGFLFSDDLKENPLSKENFAVIGDWVKAHMKKDEDENTYLSTPDVIVWATK